MSLDFSMIKSIVIPEGKVKQIARKSGGFILWKGGHTNLVPTSIDTDGNVFDGVGYRDGYRLSSSGGLSAQANTFTTGFIPVTASDVIRMAGVEWFPPSGNLYLAFYDSGFALLGSLNCYVSSTAASGYTSTSRGIVTHKTNGKVGNAENHPTVDSNGVITFNQYGFTDGSNVAYFRINGYGAGADAIVTVNEEITL